MLFRMSSVLPDDMRDAAGRHGISSGGGNVPKSGKTPLRSWIAEVVAGGLERDVFSPADVTRHIPPGEWVKDVPLEVVAKMIAAGLTRPSFDPRLALEHLTPQVIGEYVAPHLAWALIDEGAVRAFDLQGSRGGARPAARPPLPPPAAMVPSAPATAGSTATATESEPAPALAAGGQPEAAPAWDKNAESADAWVETDMVESVETNSSN